MRDPILESMPIRENRKGAALALAEVDEAEAVNEARAASY